MPRDERSSAYNDVYGYEITLRGGNFEDSDVTIQFDGSGSGRSSGSLELDPEEVRPFVDAIIAFHESKPEVYPDLDIPTINTQAGAKAVVQSFITVARPMVIDYVKENGDEVRRVVSPHNIQAIKDGSQFLPPEYVNGWDHTADGPRNFRLTRITGIAPAKENYIPKA